MKLARFISILLFVTLLFLLAGCGERKEAAEQTDAGNYAEAVSILDGVKPGKKTDALYARIGQLVEEKTDALLSEKQYEAAFRALDGLESLPDYETLRQSVFDAAEQEIDALLAERKYDDAIDLLGGTKELSDDANLNGKVSDSVKGEYEELMQKDDTESAKTLAETYKDQCKDCIVGFTVSFTGEKCYAGDEVKTNDFTLTYLYADGSSKVLAENEFELESGEKTYRSGAEQTFRFKEERYGLTASVTVIVPAPVHLSGGMDRTAFSRAFYSDLKGVGLKKYSMEINKNDDGEVYQASFKDSMGRYCYFMRFGGGENASSETFNSVSISNNTTAGYSGTDMHLLRMVLIRQTYQDGDTGIVDVMDSVVSKDGSITANGVSYSSYTGTTEFLGSTYMTGSINVSCSQEPVRQK